ncbi:MAG: hypothetical protein Q4F84_04990, partial [Fibrobacter sp.]|nr:hypothetical protein [Fibrobacter sp.]
VIFIGGTKHVFGVSLGKETPGISRTKSCTLDKIIIICLSLWVLTFGVCVPDFFQEILQKAAAIINR